MRLCVTPPDSVTLSVVWANFSVPVNTRASQATMDAEETQVSVKLVTHLPEQYKVPEDVLVCTISGMLLSAAFSANLC